MRLLVKVIPLRAGTAEPAGDPQMSACPPDVGADTILSFLAGWFGAVVETAWTSTERHPRVESSDCASSRPRTWGVGAVRGPRSGLFVARVHHR